MARRKAFAQTWWGNAWIEAMEGIDRDTNRLPRGRTYARNGSVVDIRLHKGAVEARVQGRRPTPYKIAIRMKAYDVAQSAALLRLIAETPAIAGDLSLGRLPQELLDICRRKHIPLLPQSWADLTATCSCPDWANPCKHLAAVYYMVAQEIDKDPFMIFTLRGVSHTDLAGGMVTAQPQASPKLSFLPRSQVALRSTTPQQASMPRFSLDMDGSFFRVLEKDPLFYPASDFRKLLETVYDNVALRVNTLVVDEEPGLDAVCSGLVCTDEDLVPSWQVVAEGDDLSLHDCLHRYLLLPLASDDKQVHPAEQYLRTAAAAALGLARAKRYTPETACGPDGRFVVRYRPQLDSEAAAPIKDYLEAIYSVDFLTRAGDQALVAPDEGVAETLTLFLSALVQEFNGLNRQDKLCRVFFGGEVFVPDGFAEQQTAQTVNRWLTSVSLDVASVTSVIRVEPTKKDRYRVGVELQSKEDPLAASLPFPQVLTAKGMLFGQQAKEVRQAAVQQMSIAAKYYEPLRTLANGGASIALDGTQVAELMVHAKPIFELLGFKLRVPKQLLEFVTPRLSMKASSQGSARSYLSFDDLLEFSWQVAIGDEQLSKQDFQRLASSATGIIQVRDTFVYLDPQMVTQLLEQMERPVPQLGTADVLQATLTGEVDNRLFVPDEDLAERVRALTNPQPIDEPQAFQGTLRPYQTEGYHWLYHHLNNGFGCCLADDMGLGKTIQTLVAILKLKEDNLLTEPVLLICPTTLVGNWEKECAKFAPTLKVSAYHGQGRRLEAAKHDIVLTTYTLGRKDQDKLRRRTWGLVILDEAQSIKNPDSQQTRAIKSLKAKGYLALTGTPVENRLRELWSIFDFLNPGYFGSVRSFQSRFATPIEKYNDGEAKRRLGLATGPFILRRLKTDKRVISDLPEKIVEDEYCHLKKEQAALYQGVVDRTLAAIEASEGIERRGLVFSLLTSLKQVCNHPVQYTKQGSPRKEHSGKAERLVELVGQLVGEREQVLIFTQYREMAKLLRQLILEDVEIDPLIFHGQMSRTQRDAAVAEFQKGANPVMIISLKAGGTGLNLTAASHVIHYDLWWNPAVEAQATDRAYRIGQHQVVTVRRFITLGTFEEKINEMLEAKRELAEAVLAGSEGSLGDLNDEELRSLFRFEGAAR